MTQSTMRETLLEHYKATRARLGDNRTPARPIIPADRIKPLELPAPRKPDQTQARAESPQPPPIQPPKASARRYVHVLHEVATRHGMPVEALIGRSRNMRYVEARQEAFYRLKQAGYSFPQIGQFCNRDHTTILHGVKKYEAQLKANRGEK